MDCLAGLGQDVVEAVLPLGDVAVADGTAGGAVAVAVGGGGSSSGSSRGHSRSLGSDGGCGRGDLILSGGGSRHDVSWY